MKIIEKGYLILSRETVDGKITAYRGVDRRIPAYPEEKGEEFELWKRYAELFDVDQEFIKNKELALEVVKEYVKYNTYLDLIKIIQVSNYSIVMSKRLPTQEGEFLGLDVVLSSVYSLIADHPTAWNEQSLPSHSSAELQKAWPLLKLEGLYFSERLNNNGLFNELEDAELYLNVKISQGECYPNLYEANITKLKIFAVYLIESTIDTKSRIK